MSVHSINNRNSTVQSLTPELPAAAANVLEFLRTQGSYGATRHEIASALNMPLSGVCGRIAELERRTLVESTEHRRPTPCGKSATVIKIRFQPGQQLDLDFGTSQ